MIHFIDRRDVRVLQLSLIILLVAAMCPDLVTSVRTTTLGKNLTTHRSTTNATTVLTSPHSGHHHHKSNETTTKEVKQSKYILKIHVHKHRILDPTLLTHYDILLATIKPSSLPLIFAVILFVIIGLLIGGIIYIVCADQANKELEKERRSAKAH